MVSEKLTKIPLPNKNIVILGSFNPTIIQPSFLRRFKILPEQEIRASEAESAHSKDRTKPLEIEVSRLLISGGKTILIFQSLVFDVTREKFQVTLKSGADHEIVTDSLKKLFTILEHTPVTAMGFNCHAHWKTANGLERLRQLFTGDAHQFKAAFGDKATVGGRVRFNLLNAKVLLETEQSSQLAEGIFFNFNFHYDLSPPSAMSLVKLLPNFDKAMEHAKRLATSVYGIPSAILEPDNVFQLLERHQT